MPQDSDQDARTAESLIRDLQERGAAPCPSCSKALWPQEVLMAIALGFNNAPRCLACLAAGMETDPPQLAQSVFDYIRGRDCFAEAWQWASCQTGTTPDRVPLELLAAGAPVPEHAAPPAAFWDAGDQGCGELVLELRRRLEALPPEGILELTARDPGVPEDLPAWCRATGHRLLRRDPPRYWIRRKGR